MALTNVTEELTIKVIHGYIEVSGISTVTYDESGVATVTNSTSIDNPNYMAYISADYVNYLISKGYTKLSFKVIPDNTIANQACVGCSANDMVVRTAATGSRLVATITLKADSAIMFWCQSSGSGANIQGQGGYLTVTFNGPSA